MTMITLETIALLTVGTIGIAAWIWLWIVAAIKGGIAIIDFQQHGDVRTFVYDSLWPATIAVIAATSGWVTIHIVWPTAGLNMLIWGA